MAGRVDEAKGFFQEIEEGEGYKFVSEVTTIGAFVDIIVSVAELTDEKDDPIADILHNLTFSMESGFQDLGNFILEQAHLGIQETRLAELRQGVANARTAEGLLHDMRVRPDLASGLLVQADTESRRALEFFRQVSSPFFVGGLLLAGSVRLHVVWELQEAAPTNDILAPLVLDPEYVNEIQAVAGQVKAMAASIRDQVNGEHRVEEGRTTWPIHYGKGVGDGPISYFAHNQVILRPTYGGMATDVQRINTWYYGDNPRFIGRPKHFTPFHDDANAAAQADRDKGVQEELNFLGVPEMETVARKWQQSTAPRPRRITVIGKLRTPRSPIDIKLHLP